MTTLPDPESVVLRHVTDEDLLAYLDGELSGEAHRDAAHHLSRCWDCRTKLAAIQARIDAFMQVRRGLSPEALGPDAPAIDAFKRRLAGHAAARSAEARAPRALTWLAGIASRPAFAVLALAVLVVAGAVGWFYAPLSADAVLARAEVEEIGTTRRASAIVKNVIQIDRVDPSGSRKRLSVVSTVADNSSPALSVSIGTADGALEEDVLTSEAQLLLHVTAHIRFGQPLVRYVVAQQWVPGVSAVEYRKLIRDRGVIEAFAERTGQFVELRHPFREGHPSGVVETRIRLDGRSWIPIEITIVAMEEGVRQEYRLTRTGVEILARTEALAALFASAGARATPPGDVADPRADALSAARRRARPLSYDGSLATPAEVDVAVALHSAGADLGEELNVFQMSDGSLLVQGVLDRQERRAQLEGVLQSIDGVRVELHAGGTPAALRPVLFDPPWRASMRAVRMPSAGTPTIRVADFAGATMPMYATLRAHLAASQGGPAATDEAIAAFATGVLKRSGDALFAAWALRKLDLQFSGRRVQELPESSLDQIERLRKVHRETVARHARDLLAILDEVAPQVSRGPLGAETAAAEPLLSLASEQHQLVRSLFTASSAPGDPAASVGRLKSMLARMDAGS